jgi:hypothetical protein
VNTEHNVSDEFARREREVEALEKALEEEQQRMEMRLHELPAAEQEEYRQLKQQNIQLQTTMTDHQKKLDALLKGLDLLHQVRALCPLKVNRIL